MLAHVFFCFLKVCNPEHIRDRLDDHLDGRLDDHLLEKIKRHPLIKEVTKEAKKVGEVVVKTAIRELKHFKKYFDNQKKVKKANKTRILNENSLKIKENIFERLWTRLVSREQP